MAKCDVCNKETVMGNNVSHSYRKTGRIWKPNVKRVKVIIKGASRKINVCTRCLRSNKVKKAV